MFNKYKEEKRGIKMRVKDLLSAACIDLNGSAGSKQEAIEMAKSWRQDGYPEAYIAVIAEGRKEPMCIEEITDFE